jgi:hypothetical protein
VDGAVIQCVKLGDLVLGVHYPITCIRWSGTLVPYNSLFTAKELGFALASGIEGSSRISSAVITPSPLRSNLAC